MKKPAEHRHHAEERRPLARMMVSTEQREQLLDVTADREDMARDRRTLLRRRPKLAREGEARRKATRRRTRRGRHTDAAGSRGSWAGAPAWPLPHARAGSTSLAARRPATEDAPLVADPDILLWAYPGGRGVGRKAILGVRRDGHHPLDPPAGAQVTADPASAGRLFAFAPPIWVTPVATSITKGSGSENDA